MTPDDLIARQTEGRGNAVALQGTRRPPAQHDRQDPLLVDARALGQLQGVDTALGAELRDALEGLRHDRSPPSRRLTGSGRTAGRGRTGAPPAPDAPRRPAPERRPTQWY